MYRLGALFHTTEQDREKQEMEARRLEAGEPETVNLRTKQPTTCVIIVADQHKQMRARGDLFGSTGAMLP